MCQLRPTPPANVNTSPPAPSPNQTTRQRFAQHEADPVCGACHKLMDPIGLGFSNYDAVGAYRATEAGHPIPASGSIVGADAAIAGAVNHVRGVARQVSASA